MGKNVILCVDDESSILESLEMELSIKNTNYVIELAESGQEALEIAKEVEEEGNHLTVVLSDYIMPTMKGDELLIKLHQLYPLSKKILLTGQAALEGVTNATNNANLYRFIEKPWDRDDLRLTVQEAIRKYLVDKKLDDQQKLIAKLNEAIDNRDHGQAGEKTIEDILYERELYDQLFFIRYYQTLSDKAQDWLSKAAIGIICADHKISRSEKLFFEAIVKHDRNEERVLNHIEMIKGNIQPKLGTLKVDEETTFNLLDNLAWILVANQTIKPAEQKYFEFICSTVGVDDKIASGFLDMAKARIESNQIRQQTKQEIMETKLIYRPDMQPPTFLMKKPEKPPPNPLLYDEKQTYHEPAEPEDKTIDEKTSPISRSPHNNSIKIRLFHCFVCDSNKTIQFNILEPKSQKLDHNIFGIQTYTSPNEGFKFIDFNQVKLALCPSCYFTSSHKEHFRRTPADEPPDFLANRSFINFWTETILNRQEKILNFDLNDYFNLQPSLALVETIYDFGVQVAEKVRERSEDAGIKWQEITLKLTVAEILSISAKSEKVNQLLKECQEKSRAIFETSYDLEYTYKSGRLLFFIALYLEDKKTYGEMLEFFSRNVREIKKQTPDEEKLLRRTADDLKRSYEDREDFSQKSLIGFHHKPLEKKPTPDT